MTMGYILPINFYQYQHYHERIKGVKIDKFRTTGLERVKKAYLFRLDPSSEGKYPSGKRSRRNQENNADKVYAQLTGIGGNINECV